MRAGFTVWLEENGKYVMGEKEAKILKGIRKFGSLMSAAKSIGVTYAYAWNLLERLASRTGEEVVKARRGGESGGGMMLTKAGEELLAEYNSLQKKASGALDSPKEFTFRDFRSPDLSIIGSSCAGVKILIGLMDIKVEYIEVGSTAGLTALMLGEADISGIHLYDEESGSYNIPFLKRGWPEGTAALIRGYRREQGFMVKRGNPKGFFRLEDLGGDVRLVNRNLGSGTRGLLDRLLRTSGINPRCIRGYEFEVRSHEQVAKAVQEGRADVGLGLRATASIFGLDFIKVGDECFDFALERRRLGKEGVKKFREVLTSAKFREKLSKRAPGIYLQADTGDVVF